LVLVGFQDLILAGKLGGPFYLMQSRVDQKLILLQVAHLFVLLLDRKLSRLEGITDGRTVFVVEQLGVKGSAKGNTSLVHDFLLLVDTDHMTHS
jgi:hypothetical protein